jgi:hypothetical protein
VFIYEKPASKATDFPLGLFLLPRLPDLLFVALLVGVLGLGPRLLNVDGDLGRHLTLGGYILDNFRIPQRDLFSHTLAGLPLTPHEWLSQVLFALANRLGGLNGVVMLSAILIAITFSLVFHQCASRSQSPSLSLVLSILAAGAASLHWLARPHLFTLLLVVLWTGELERIRTGATPRFWIFPGLMLLWANLHGAFIAGFVLLGFYLAGELVEWSSKKAGEESRTSSRSAVVESRGRIRTLLLAGSASFLASLVNPAGPRLWETSLGFLRNRYLVGHTAEYLPPDFQTPTAWPFLLMIVLSILLLGSGRWRAGATPVLVLAAWTAMGLYSIRNVPLYAVIGGPILAAAAGAWLQSESALAPWRRLDQRLDSVEASLRGHLWPAMAIFLAALAFAGGIRLDFTAQGNRFDPDVFPVAAVDWLESQSLTGNGFNHFPWGGYLLYRLWPEMRVFIDGQTDFYGESFTRQYEQVIELREGWREVLGRYETSWVLVPPGSALGQALSQEPGWREVYRDQTASIFISQP